MDSACDPSISTAIAEPIHGAFAEAEGVRRQKRSFELPGRDPDEDHGSTTRTRTANRASG
jgi:hypothetical protein